MEDSAFDSVLRSDLTSFILKCFMHLSPGKTILFNWHIEVIAQHLEAACKGQITRLIISMPPRNLKSICTNVAWTAWALGHNPSSRIITASYSRELSIKHSMDARAVVSSEWFGRIFPGCVLSREQNSKTKFKTTMHGFRFATSVDSTITGEGADYIVLDDPHNPMHIFSDKRRKKVIEWFEQVVMSRLNDRSRGAIVLIMHRLHQSDLVGWLLSGSQRNSWTYLSLPLVADQDLFFSIDHPVLKRRIIGMRAGDCLHQERYSANVVQQIKQEVGACVFSAQYMQKPLDFARNPIKMSWLARYTERPQLNNITISWDTASSRAGCYSVASVWSITEGKRFLLSVIRGRWSYSALKKKVIETYEYWKATTVLIENKSSGQQLIQDLPPHIKVVAVNPEDDKLTRLNRVAPLFENGNVKLPEHADWLVDFEYELLSFPDSVNDDQVDSISQYLNWSLLHEGKREFRISVL